MDEQIRTDEDPVLSVRLDVWLDRQPISGRLRTERGADEQFVGWLGFVERPEEIARARGPVGECGTAAVASGESWKGDGTMTPRQINQLAAGTGWN